MIRYGIPHLPVLQIGGLSIEKMRRVGECQIQLERSRIGQGLDIADGPAKSLSQRYAKQKQKAGQPAVRNLLLTGRMLGSRTIIQASGNMVAIGFGDQAMYLRAQVNENIDPMLGCSPSDRRKLDRFALGLFSYAMAA